MSEKDNATERISRQVRDLPLTAQLLVLFLVCGGGTSVGNFFTQKSTEPKDVKVFTDATAALQSQIAAMQTDLKIGSNESVQLQEQVKALSATVAELKDNNSNPTLIRAIVRDELNERIKREAFK